MDYLKLALRLIHILGGTFWVGAALLMNFFIGPTLRATGDAGKQFAGYFIGKTRFSIVMNIAAFSTIIAGFLLYGINSNWYSFGGWAASSTARAFDIGAFFALIGLVSGYMNGANNRKMGMLGAQIQGMPTPEQAAAMQAIAKQQGWVVPLNTASLLLAITIMALARYL